MVIFYKNQIIAKYKSVSPKYKPNNRQIKINEFFLQYHSFFSSSTLFDKDVIYKNIEVQIS